MDESRIKAILQKRTSLKRCLTQLENAIEEIEPDKGVVKHRFNHIKEAIQTYENLHDDWSVSNPDDERLKEFDSIQDRYFKIASKVDKILDAVSLNETVSIAANASIVTETNRNRPFLKLPDANVPQFSGDYCKWLTFKNTFNSMIHSRKDLSNEDKFIYLQTALKGDALAKISSYDVSAENYDKAWNFLVKSYEIHKIIITRHLQCILNLPVVEKESHDTLIKLTDEAHQHVSALESLNVTIGSEMLAQILESKLPKSLTDEWDRLVPASGVSKFDELCDFITSVAVRLAKNVKPKSDSKKREIQTKRVDSQNKRIRTDERHSFIAQTMSNCVICKDQQHQLYRCQRFRNLSVPERINIVKSAKLCFNCMRQHRGLCTLSNCTLCNKRHNTLLH